MKTCTSKTPVNVALLAMVLAAGSSFTLPVLAQDTRGTQAAASPQRVQISGSTSAGKPFKGFGQVPGVADQGRKATVVVEIEGVGQQSFQVAIPEGHELTGLRIDETAPAKGAKTFIDELFGEASGPLDKTPTFEARPITRPAAAEEQAEEEQDEPDFEVEIVRENGTSLVGAEFEYGAKTELRVKLKGKDGATAPGPDEITSITWTVHGPSIKSFTHRLVGSDAFAHEFAHKAQQLTQQDLVISGADLTRSKDAREPTLSFFFTKGARSGSTGTAGNASRRVSVSVEAREHTVGAEGSLKASASENPARMFFMPLTVRGAETVQQRHSAWHGQYRWQDATSMNGERFIRFHRNFLAAYDAWRATFGYKAVEPVDDPAKPGFGLRLPGYLTPTGRDEFDANTNAALKGMVSSQANARQGLAVSRQWREKYEADWQRSHPGKKLLPTQLSDFDTFAQLGDAVENPWHNWGHGVETQRGETEMRSSWTAPHCEVFYMWHKKVDRATRRWRP